MNRGILDITHGAELYRKYEMLGEGKEETKKEDHYLFEEGHRLDKLRQYYQRKGIELETIGSLSDCFIYGFNLDNKETDNKNELEFELDKMKNIEDTLELGDKVFDITNSLMVDSECFFEDFRVKVLEDSVVLHLIFKK